MNLLEIISMFSGVPFKKHAQRDGGEWHGACPMCGGTDRFHVWPSATIPTFWCRVCDKKGGAIKFLMEYRQLSVKEAIQELKRNGYNIDENVEYKPKPEKLEPAPTLSDYLNFKFDVSKIEDWYQTGRRRAIWYYSQWGLTEEDIDRHGVGSYSYNGYVIYTIPHWWIDGDNNYHLKGIKFRRTKMECINGEWVDTIAKDARFFGVDGSNTGGVWGMEYISNPDGTRDGMLLNQLLIVEAEKDAALLIGLGYPTIAFTEEKKWVQWLPYCLKNVVEPIFIADNDGGKGLNHSLRSAKYLKTPYRIISTEKYNVKAASDLAKAGGRNAVTDWLKENRVEAVCS